MAPLLLVSVLMWLLALVTPWGPPFVLQRVHSRAVFGAVVLGAPEDADQGTGSQETVVSAPVSGAKQEEQRAAAGCRRGVEKRRGVRENVTYHHQLSSSARAVFAKTSFLDVNQERRGRKSLARSCGKQVPDAKRKRDVATRLRYAS
ncbi:hypothetical protein BC835DRAFT_1306521 [Cytidiella melzeri]|nr:hypothetical protein BC835DRAFT_1306521 [Cytidiella melzeri]